MLGMKLISVVLLAGYLAGCCTVPAMFAGPVTAPVDALQQLFQSEKWRPGEKIVLAVPTFFGCIFAGPAIAGICGVSADIGFVMKGHYKGSPDYPGYWEAFRPVRCFFKHHTELASGAHRS